MNKRLIICCDGTWNDLEMRYITNVGRLVQCLLPTGRCPDGSEIPQIIYYDDGVGADAGGLQRMLQGGFGHGIDNLIYEAYRFLCFNYKPGDEVCLYGFSRGAFTVRSLAGMIGRVGLVQRCDLKYVPKALNAYRSKNTASQQQFRDSVKSLDIGIDLLGCWDTVGALGIPDKIPWLPIDEWATKKYRFHNTDLGSNIKRAIHAVAIDERRKEFQATLMHKPAGAPSTQKLVQTWFPGDHGCVGGGSWEKRGLSNQCLKWMIDTTRDLGIELGVDLNRLHDHAIADESIYFPTGIKGIYSVYDRPLPEKSVTWNDIHITACNRWADLDDYRPPKLKRRFGSKLDKHVSNVGRHTFPDDDTLAIGDSAFVRVFSVEKKNESNIKVSAGQEYAVEISRVQVWKDGNLDPCDARGWNLIKSGDRAKRPYQDGEPIDLGAFKSTLIGRAEGKRVVPAADWFELIYRIGRNKFSPIGLNQPLNETDPFTGCIRVDVDGELILAANDLESRLKFIDKYDNNVGWIWVKVTRTA